MSSSKVITSNFDFFSAKTVSEAVEHLGREGAVILSGGTDLINQLKADKLTPSEVIYINNIPELRELSVDSGLTIGAAVPMETVEKNPDVKRKYPGLTEAVNSVGGWQIRNTATVTGNICNASPGADTVPVLVVHNARVIIAGKKEVGGVAERSLLVKDFLTGPGKTSLKKGEMVTAVMIPPVPEGSSSAFMRIARVTLDIAKINCSAWIELEEGICKDVRVAIGSVAPTVVRAPSVEALLKNQKVNSELIEKAAAESVKDISPISDIRSTEEYRKQVVKVLVRDVLEKAVERAKGDRL